MSVDLNTALVSFLLTDLVGFSSAAGHIGPNCRVDHDISYLIPEIWCRLSPEERDPKMLIDQQLDGGLVVDERCVVETDETNQRQKYGNPKQYLGSAWRGETHEAEHPRR